MPWYQMPVTFQKEILCAIQSAQNGAVLTMGPLGELDFEMAATVSFKLNSKAYIHIYSKLSLPINFSYFIFSVYSTYL